jgi:hypothetical protein
MTSIFEKKVLSEISLYLFSYTHCVGYIPAHLPLVALVKEEASERPVALAGALGEHMGRGGVLGEPLPLASPPLR